MKKKGKKEKPRKKNFLSELESVIYEQQIIDNNRQLARLRIHNEELETKVKSIKKKLNELEENKTDLTSHLQQVLQKKTEEVHELHERLIAFEKIYSQEYHDFKKKEELLEYEFRTMENNLTAEIKLAAGKLNSLEEWRLNRSDLMSKFKKQEENILEQEIHHKKILYETEKKFIIDKARMQNELENRLTELARSFRMATTLRLADATQSAVRENNSLHQELNYLLDQCRTLDATVQDYKERERTWRLYSSLYEAEARLASHKVTKQSRAIEYLTMEHGHMSRTTTMIHRGEMHELLNKKVVEEIKLNVEDTQNKIRILRQNIEVVRNDRDDVMKEVFNNCQEIQRLGNILIKIKDIIKQTILMQAQLTYEDEDACSMCFIDIKEKFIHSLLDILESYQTSSVQLTKETVSESINNLYEFGNLGLIPTLMDSKYINYI